MYVCVCVIHGYLIWHTYMRNRCIDVSYLELPRDFCAGKDTFQPLACGLFFCLENGRCAAGNYWMKRHETLDDVKLFPKQLIRHERIEE